MQRTARQGRRLARDEFLECLGCRPRQLLTSKEGYEQVLRHLHNIEPALDTG